jgi:hypothetical protein
MLTEARPSLPPPGVGKTQVALELINEADHSNGLRSFFLVTTRDLAEQQFARVEAYTAVPVKLCVGRELDMWEKADVSADMEVSWWWYCTARAHGASSSSFSGRRSSASTRWWCARRRCC